MSNRRCSATAALAVCIACTGCGPSAAELAAREQQAALQRTLAETRQYNDDLKFRLQLAQARSKLLLGLVQGLTIDPDHFAPTPEKLATADASLQSIDRDVEALIATVRTSRQDAAALREQREALQRDWPTPGTPSSTHAPPRPAWMPARCRCSVSSRRSVRLSEVAASTSALRTVASPSSYPRQPCSRRASPI